MNDQVNLPVNREDRDAFKKMAVDKQKSMKDLFHEWILKWREWEKFK
jgi:hypothetical protein